MTTNKQQSQSAATAATTASEWDAKLELNLTTLKEWLLGDFDKQRSALDEVSQRMRAEGITEETIKRCIYYETSIQEQVNKETIKLATNPKSKKLWDLATLEAGGRLSNSEIESIKAQHGGHEPPYWYCTGIRRTNLRRKR